MGHPEYSQEHATTDLPLQRQLMGSLALVLVLSMIAGIVGYATFDSSTLENNIRAKSHMYSSNMVSTLYGAVATGDAGSAEDALQQLASDRNVYGAAVYSPRGRRLAGIGKYPERMATGDVVKMSDDRLLVTTSEI